MDELIAALEPFAQAAEWMTEFDGKRGYRDDARPDPAMPLTYGDYRRAAAALARAKAPPADDVVERQKHLIRKIIDAYHTTRLASASPEDHILSKPWVRDAFAALSTQSPERTVKEDLTVGDVIQADREAAEEAVSAANIVSHDGYYEADIDAVTKALARHRIATQSQAAVERDEVRQKLPMIVSHATGGHTSDIERSTNDIAVEISRHHNRVWQHAQEVGAKEMREAAAKVAEDRAPVIQCLSVEPVVSACTSIATAIRSLPLPGESA